MNTFYTLSLPGEVKYLVAGASHEEALRVLTGTTPIVNGVSATPMFPTATFTTTFGLVTVTKVLCECERSATLLFQGVTPICGVCALDTP